MVSEQKERWYITISESKGTNDRYCTYSKIIDEHPVVWAIKNNAVDADKGIVFAMRVPEGD